VGSGLFIIFSERERKKILTKNFLKKTKSHSPIRSLNKIMNNKNFSRIEEIEYKYLKTYLQGLLIVNDKITMAHSIESRTPLCDNELVKFANSISPKYKLHKNELKYLLKESMRSKLPKEIYEQPKTGFTTPFSLWIRKELKDYIYNILLDERTRNRGIFKIGYVKKMLDKFCNKKSDTLFDLVTAHKIWALLSIELWFRIFIDPQKNIKNF
ncbi:hypothetical protein GF386_00090, partial [Candidatus Pacearchaeota archaeon]|nr:hypothetical protein [Candidatus Pacearchaeota archaeon]MBD3282681.1 hypothetical protein [Candidatus Pacearchaeota archaeon]